jgi:hypothetical protein
MRVAGQCGAGGEQQGVHTPAQHGAPSPAPWGAPAGAVLPGHPAPGGQSTSPDTATSLPQNFRQVSNSQAYYWQGSHGPIEKLKKS